MPEFTSALSRTSRYIVTKIQKTSMKWIQGGMNAEN